MHTSFCWFCHAAAQILNDTTVSELTMPKARISKFKMLDDIQMPDEIH